MSASKLDPELKKQLTERVGLLAASFPSVAITGATISAYVEMLKDIPLDVLDAAIRQVLAENKFFPSIAELREKALALSHPASQHMTGYEAWETVMRELRRVGVYGQPRFDDPLITRAVECIGWFELCNSEMAGVDRAHFAKIYDQLVQREKSEARLLPEARAIRARLLPDVRRDCLLGVGGILEGGEQ